MARTRKVNIAKALFGSKIFFNIMSIINNYVVEFEALPLFGAQNI